MLAKLHSGSQLKIGAILNYAIIVLNTVVGLLYTPYMLRMMGQSEYGLYSIVASVIFLFDNFGFRIRKCNYKIHC